MADTWRKITYVKLSCSTATHRQGRMGYPQPRSYTATQYRTRFLLTDVHLIQNGKAGLGKQRSQHRPPKMQLSSTTTHQLTISQTSS